MNNREYRKRVIDMVAGIRARAAERVPDAAEHWADGLSIRNADDEAVLRIYDEISMFGVTALDVVAELDKVTAPRLRVELNSPGGNVFDGIAIHNALRAHPAQVTVRVDGIAASIASVIAQAGDTRVMQPASQMMIHTARGLTIGSADDHTDMAKILEQQDAVIAGIYAARSGGDLDEFRDLMTDETWLTDQAAVDLVLADEIDVLAAPEPAARSGFSPGPTTTSGYIVVGDTESATTTATYTAPYTVQPPAPTAPPFSEIAANAQRRRRRTPTPHRGDTS